MSNKSMVEEKRGKEMNPISYPVVLVKVKKSLFKVFFTNVCI